MLCCDVRYAAMHAIADVCVCCKGVRDVPIPIGTTSDADYANTDNHGFGGGCALAYVAERPHMHVPFTCLWLWCAGPSAVTPTTRRRADRNPGYAL